MDPWGRGFLVSAVMQSTPASMTGIVILHSILETERDRSYYAFNVYTGLSHEHSHQTV